ncbi:MAG TPA: outer membrane protein assembly factor BamE [Burkholderiaceae bacterium]|nr:outer membrane protein assembly factor BamE [Burkholderiaceae bacterium]
MALAALLSGCQYLPSLPTPNWSADRFLGVVTPYRIEIVQGNVITREQADATKIGMSRAQVRDVLGSPLLADVFHANRWDYVFTIRRPGAESQSRHVVVRFADDKLASIDTGGPLPTEREFVASIDTFKTQRNAPPLELTPEQLKALPAPAPAPAVAVEPTGPTRPYPPLEPAS